METKRTSHITPLFNNVFIASTKKCWRKFKFEVKLTMKFEDFNDSHYKIKNLAPRREESTKIERHRTESLKSSRLS